MKPWPEVLRKAFPLRPDQHPVRPWWRQDVSQGKMWERHIRLDGKELRGTRSLDVEALERALAVADADEPPTHPGFRVGQVWATQTGEAWQVVLGSMGKLAVLVYETNAFGRPCGLDYVLIQAGWDFGSTEDLFLVADPCCPHLAPWSPP